MTFTPAELAYLRSQRLGRLATVDAHGAPQNNPVAYRVDEATGTIDIGGYRMGQTRKYRNVQGNANVSLVVDDLASVTPWVARCLEIRGTAEALHDQPPPLPGMTGDVLRITPRRILAFGIDPDAEGPTARDVAPA